MVRLIVFGLAVLSTLIIVGGYVGWTMTKSNNSLPLAPSTSPTPIPTSPPEKPSPTPDNSTTEIPINDNSTETQDEPPIDSSISLAQIEQARDDAVFYLQTLHPEITYLFNGDEWQGGFVSSLADGTQKYVYSSIGWNVTLQFSIVINPIFNINVNYSGVYAVTWRGTYENGTVTEKSFTSNVPTHMPNPT